MLCCRSGVQSESVVRFGISADFPIGSGSELANHRESLSQFVIEDVYGWILDALE